MELLAWLADTLARRLDQLESEAYLSTAGLTAAALTLASKIRTQPDHGVLKPVRYFEGRQLLDADDLEVEVDYPPSQCRHKFGAGIVSGLDISAQAEGNGLRITPGYAIDNRGRDIVVNRPLTFDSFAGGRARLGHLAARAALSTIDVARALVDCEFLVVENPERDDLFARVPGTESSQLAAEKIRLMPTNIKEGFGGARGLTRGASEPTASVPWERFGPKCDFRYLSPNAKFRLCRHSAAP